MPTHNAILVPDQRIALEVTTHSWWDIRGPFEWVPVVTNDEMPSAICSVTVNAWSGDTFVTSAMMHRGIHRQGMEYGDWLSTSAANTLFGALPIQSSLFGSGRR